MNNHDKIPMELLERIEAYFDCRLSDEEESRLCQELLASPYHHSAIDEALAVMGFKTIRGESQKEATEKKNKRLRNFKPVYGVAATVAILLLIGLTVFSRFSGAGAHQCIAYVNGLKVTSEEEVVNIMLINMNEFEDGANAMENDLIFELDQIVYDNE